MKHYFAGGDAAPPPLKSEFSRCFGRPLHEGFGITETEIIAMNWSGTMSKARSFGCPAPGVEIAVAIANGDLLPPGSVGEMIVSSEGNLVGYWQDPGATEKAIEDGSFHTGDLAACRTDPWGARGFVAPPL